MLGEETAYLYLDEANRVVLVDIAVFDSTELLALSVEDVHAVVLLDHVSTSTSRMISEYGDLTQRFVLPNARGVCPAYAMCLSSRGVATRPRHDLLYTSQQY